MGGVSAKAAAVKHISCPTCRAESDEGLCVLPDERQLVLGEGQLV